METMPNSAVFLFVLNLLLSFLLRPLASNLFFFIPLFKRWFVSLLKNEKSQSPFIGVRLYRCNYPGRSDGATS